MEEILSFTDIGKLLKDPYNFVEILEINPVYIKSLDNTKYEEAHIYLESMITRYINAVIHNEKENITFDNAKSKKFILEVDNVENLIEAKEFILDEIEATKKRITKDKINRIKKILAECVDTYNAEQRITELTKDCQELIDELDERKKEILQTIENYQK